MIHILRQINPVCIIQFLSLKLFLHLRLGLPNILFPSDFPINFNAFFYLLWALYVPSTLTVPDLIILIISDAKCNLWSPSLCCFRSRSEPLLLVHADNLQHESVKCLQTRWNCKMNTVCSSETLVNFYGYMFLWRHISEHSIFFQCKNSIYFTSFSIKRWIQYNSCDVVRNRAL
jgi:hypothetical protein